MTVIMALKRNDQVWLGSDTRITDGEYKVDFSLSGMDSKLIILNNAVIGTAGDLTVRNYLELFVSKQKKPFLFDHKLDVIEFFIAFKKFLKREGGLGDAGYNEMQGVHNASWLVATASQIFTIDQDGAVLEHPEMCVIGSGTYTARAILEYMLQYDPKLSPFKMLSRAHEISVKHNLTCGGKQILLNVTKTLTET